MGRALSISGACPASSLLSAQSYPAVSSGGEGTVNNNPNQDLSTLDLTRHKSVSTMRAQDSPEFAIEQEQLELNRLWQRFGAALAAMDLGPTDWPLDGWLQAEGETRPPFPVILVQFKADGVGVVLGMEHPVWPGRLGDLTTQAHGAGCSHRPVLCQGREIYFRDRTLHYAALRIVPEPRFSAGCGEPGRWGG